ncbi:MAG: sigma-70 family RNA polymerase sigma factor [Aeromicrobium sp.]|uniref:sigma-70 family RNA polymerase sigma factor n=1 Tax=Aeromicrobium sp. TaxID=1871063 RepID=UPI0025C1AF83|nr:sigma-70 family RNA polymerase sigma factor [Aeromicrobium sp.]MCK5892391.1 sigma-70 family RNA polymerase sigma factor [Aeromicrobium sp.]MDF1706065.1 sigma-70 family RNA polymerase sigma factor [Aeromicrobium sp.]
MAATAHDQHQLIVDHLPLAARLARGYRGRGVDADDLEQVARLALVKAAAGFEEERGAFAAFATATIRGELKRHFRDRAWGVRPPRRVQELQSRLGAEHDGTDITTAQIADLSGRLGVPASELTEAVAARGCFTPDSIEAAYEAGHEMGCVDGRFDVVDGWVTFTRLCRDLPREDRQLLQWRFVDDLTQQEIADQIGISQMQVSRRISALLGRLRAAAEGPGATEAA